MKYCLICGKELTGKKLQYCSTECYKEARFLWIKNKRQQIKEVHKAEIEKIRAEKRKAAAEKKRYNAMKMAERKKELKAQRLDLEKLKVNKCKYCGQRCEGEYCCTLHKCYDKGYMIIENKRIVFKE